METARALRRSIQKNDLAVSLDLSDAFFTRADAQIDQPVPTVCNRRFAIDGVVYSFMALPFGLNLSPWIFTRLVDAVVAVVRLSTTSQISNYLDDFLQKIQVTNVLTRDLQVLLQSLHSLGFQVNILKSYSTPCTDFVHLGMHFLTHLDIVKPEDKRVNSMIEIALELLPGFPQTF